MTYDNLSDSTLRPSSVKHRAAPLPTQGFQQGTFLLAEEIFESLASIQRSGGRSLALDGGSRREKVALIATILFGDAGTNGLSALETARAIKK
jgi:hypothetical protein